MDIDAIATSESEMIVTLHPEKGKGAHVRRRDYFAVREKMLLLLEAGGPMGLAELIEAVCAQLYDIHPEARAWVALMVKLDLEAKGVIKTKMTSRHDRNQLVMLKSPKRRNGFRHTYQR